MKKLALTALRVLLGAAFVVSGGLKLLAPSEEFLAAIHGFELIRGPGAQTLSVALPWAEFVFGVLLMLGLWTEISGALLWILNSVFIAALSSVLIRKIPMGDCGCFGKGISLPVSSTLLLDTAIWMAFFIFWSRSRRQEAFSLDKIF